MADDKLMFVSSQKDENVLIPIFDDIYTVGTIVKIKQMLKIQGDAVRVLVEGICRAEILQRMEEEAYMSCTVRRIEESLTMEELSLEDKAAMRILRDSFIEYAALTGQVSDDMVDKAISNQNPLAVADKIAGELLIVTSRKQKILEAMDFSERLQVLTTIIAEEN